MDPKIQIKRKGSLSPWDAEQEQMMTIYKAQFTARRKLADNGPASDVFLRLTKNINKQNTNNTQSTRTRAKTRILKVPNLSPKPSYRSREYSYRSDIHQPSPQPILSISKAFPNSNSHNGNPYNPELPATNSQRITRKTPSPLSRIAKQITQAKLTTFDLEDANRDVKLMLETTINLNTQRGFYLPSFVSRTMTPRGSSSMM